jgi:hypothetical protein
MYHPQTLIAKMIDHQGLSTRHSHRALGNRKQEQRAAYQQLVRPRRGDFFLTTWNLVRPNIPFIRWIWEEQQNTTGAHVQRLKLPHAMTVDVWRLNEKIQQTLWLVVSLHDATKSNTLQSQLYPSLVVFDFVSTQIIFPTKNISWVYSPTASSPVLD